MKLTHHCVYIYLCLLFTVSLQAETHVSGIISQNTRWTAGKGPYVIMNDIEIATTCRLTIEAGTVVLIGKPIVYDTAIVQYDYTDTHMVAIKIKGMISCIGKPNKRITFRPASTDPSSPTWYGIVFDRSFDDLSEMAFVDITGACFGITAKACKPLIRNTVIERNNVGLNCEAGGSMRIYNTVITQNFTCGIKITKANPTIINSIIAFNRNNGIWSDGVSLFSCTYSCFYGNADGNCIDCDPALGALVKINTKDSKNPPRDQFFNIFADPIFSGSSADSISKERDIRTPTTITQVLNPAIAKLLHQKQPDSESKKDAKITGRFVLSTYSPCINTGSTNGKFNNADGSRNTMGITGGSGF